MGRVPLPIRLFAGRRFASSVHDVELLSTIEASLSSSSPVNVERTSLADVHTKRQLALRLVPLAWPRDRRLRLHTVAAVGCMVGSKLARLVVPWSASRAVEHPKESKKFLISLSAAKCAASALQEARSALFSRVALAASASAAAEFADKVQLLSLETISAGSPQKIAATCNRAVASVHQVLNAAVLQVVPAAVETGLTLGYIRNKLGSRCAVATAMMLAEYVRFTVKLSATRAKQRRDMQNATSKADNFFLESLTSNEMIKSYTAEEWAAGKYLELVSEATHAKHVVRKSLSVLNAGQQAIATAGLLVNLAIAHDKVVKGQAGPGIFALVVQLLNQLMGPLNFVGTIYRETSASFDNLMAVAKLVRQAKSTEGLEALPEPVTIAFENVSLTYAGAKDPALKNVSFVWNRGNKVALVGPSGAGKSSITKLLLRLYEPTEGRITLNGKDIKEYPLKEYRQLLGVVSQDFPLLSRSLLDNLLVAKPTATAKELATAALKAKISDVLMRGGILQDVGVQGSKLSGGQRQRVGLARMLLRRSPFTILDEATSALDASTEKAIVGNLPETTLSVAHRLGSVVDADNIMVMENGSVVEAGRHSDLVAAGGTYSQLWRDQEHKTIRNGE